MIDDLREATPHVTVIDDPTRKKQVWAAREAGLGATAYPPDGADTHEGWEDAAVPPDRLGDYLREFHDLLNAMTTEARRCTGISARAACTPAFRSTGTADGVADYRALRRRRRPPGRRATAAPSRANTATASPAANCCPSCSATRVVRAFEEVQGPVRPGQPDEPRQGRAPRIPSTKICAWAPDYRPPEPQTHFAYPDDEHRFSPRRAAVRRRRQVPRPRIGG